MQETRGRQGDVIRDCERGVCSRKFRGHRLDKCWERLGEGGQWGGGGAAHGVQGEP